ncbi:hypothetical protein XF_0750 [Xylella fastidiosa 9a5c]|uniref:Uncharacterized protein n=1 Tax=Xylella fastidiosa (strain 9a5c) TaxID=160492 RepID=Q9PFC8_XYLFA|nr:hypothetical protein XF_0750 [Xylella fastidiosa 9a5c]
MEGAAIAVKTIEISFPSVFMNHSNNQGLVSTM